MDAHRCATPRSRSDPVVSADKFIFIFADTMKESGMSDRPAPLSSPAILSRINNPSWIFAHGI